MLHREVFTLLTAFSPNRQVNLKWALKKAQREKKKS